MARKRSHRRKKDKEYIRYALTLFVLAFALFFLLLVGSGVSVPRGHFHGESLCGDGFCHVSEGEHDRNCPIDCNGGQIP